jgi:hypothetical protein
MRAFPPEFGGSSPKWAIMEAIMDANDRASPSAAEATLDTTRARQGVTGHNVRYVLAWGIAGVVILFAIGYFVTRGYFGA